jgi:DNA-directed RNA polymerase specialized sigma24 family protein
VKNCFFRPFSCVRRARKQIPVQHLPAEPPDTRPDPARGADFPATHWTLVEQLRGSEAQSARALEALCRNYWYPIYATLRRSGHSQHAAEDLTQGFFAELLREEILLDAQAERGRLRSFLLAALKRFVAECTRHRMAQKRGGGALILSIEWERANERYIAEPMDERDPEKIYLSTWVWNLVDRVRQKLRAGYAGREQAYAALEPFIEGEDTCAPFRELGTLLGQSESGARVTVFRLRQRFREMLIDAVRETVASPDEMQDELAWVQRVLGERRGA